MAAVDELPNDVESLKRIIVKLQERRQAEIDAAVDEAVKAAVDAAVKAAVAAILRRYYGPRSESFDPRQLLLFGQQVVDSPLDGLPIDGASIADESGEPLTTRARVTSTAVSSCPSTWSGSRSSTIWTTRRVQLVVTSAAGSAPR